LLEYQIFGVLEVASEGERLQLGPPKQRAVLAILLLNANQIVSTDRLIGLVWGDRAPRTAAHSIQIYVSELRRVLSAGARRQVIHTRPPGYVLEAEPDAIDARRFERLVESGTRELQGGDLPGGAETLREALRIWAQPLSEFSYEEFGLTEIRRLGQLRLGALEELAGAELLLGHDREVLLLVDQTLDEDPLRERSRELQMLALYRSGRHAEALRSYERFRSLLAEELGLDPSPSVRRLQERVLLHDPTLWPPAATGPTASPRVRNPYKGLRPFGEDDAGDFFGREALVGQLVAALAGSARIVALVGPSGSGKSSVASAGLIPALRGGAVPGSERWVFARMVPGQRPFEELEAALLRTRPDSMSRMTGLQDEGDDMILRAARGVLPPGGELVLVIDQFEELFSTAEETDRRRFLSSLAAVASEPQERVRVVLMLRADYYDRPLLDPVFGPVFSRRVVNAHAMTTAEVEAAIMGPARVVGVDVAPTLLAELISDTASEPGALPLLQHALTELFEHKADGALTLDDYRALGGLHGLLSRSSEELYTEMESERQRATLQVFLRMVRLGPGTQHTRRRVRVGELTAVGIDPVLLSEVLEEFGRHRLLTFDRDAITGDATVEVAHEALLTEWDRLTRWIDRFRIDLRRHAALVAAVEEWVASDRDPDYLFAGAKLAETDTWADGTALELTATERDFLEASLRRRAAEEEEQAIRSRRQQRLERRARTRLVALAAAVALLAGAVTYGVLAWPDDRPADAALLGGDPPILREMLVAGFDEAATELGIRVETVEPDGPDVSTEQLSEYSENGTGLVVALSPDCGTSAVEPAARAHPETSYVVFDCLGDEPNVAYVTFASEQGSFLAGAAAALKSQTGNVGFIGGADIPLIWEFQAGFEAGARAVNPTIEVQTDYLQPPSFSGFDDPVRAFQVAEQMYRGGADVVYPAAGSSIEGVAEAAVRLSGVLGRHLWIIGVDADLYDEVGDGDPWRPHILTSMLKRYDRAVYTLLEEHASGEFTPGVRHVDLAIGAVDLADSGGFIDDIRPELDRLRQRVIAGEIDVPTIPPDKEGAAAELGIGPEPSG
jgi:basic membrane lipoprotein Med (substrate-binding protein (PBP1-ABC) superfamily)/DNA-binding SARP family transcriptional activator